MAFRDLLKFIIFFLHLPYKGLCKTLPIDYILENCTLELIG